MSNETAWQGAEGAQGATSAQHGSDAQAAISLAGVTFHYAGQGAPALEDIDLEIRRGECVVLTGPSGCGKTTLTRLVNGLVPHVYGGELSGRVEVGGQSVSEWTADELGVAVGSVFQNPRSQFVNIDVTSEVAFGCESLGLAREEVVARVADAAAALNICGLMGRSVEELSGGQRQSVVIASAMAMRPDVFVLDEPTASLDVASMRRLAEAVRRLKALGKTVLVSEHRLWWLSGIADRVVAMEGGRITGQWSAREFGLLPAGERRARGLRSWSQGELSEAVRAAQERPCVDASEDPDNCGVEGIADMAEGPLRTPAIEASGLVVAYGRKTPVLEGLDFVLSPGRIVGIVGDNGAGKTTLLRTLCGLAKERSGTVSVAGAPLKPRRRPGRVHLVMQEPGYQLFADSVFAEACGACEDAFAQERAREMLERFGLSSLAERHPLSLSGGERQRLSVAVGMLRGASVMLLDEPTSGLDYRNMRRVADALREAADSGFAIGMVTHDLEFLCETCDEVAEVAEGSIRRRYPLGGPHGSKAVERFWLQADKTHG